MISLTRIVEQSGTDSQFYDVGKDFSDFRRMLDGADQKIKQQYEQIISSKLVGKRVRARASRGYKQYVKDYEFDISRITLDDYYDNFVVIAHDNTTPKAKEYFLKPGFKIQILGAATGQPSPQKGGNPENTKQTSPEQAQSQPMTPAPVAKPAISHGTQSEPIKEEDAKQTGLYDAYSIDDICRDIRGWLNPILLKPETATRDFVKGLGWKKELDHGTTIAIFELKIPSDLVKPNIRIDKLKEMIINTRNLIDNKNNSRFDVIKLDPDESTGVWNIRIKKTTTKK